MAPLIVPEYIRALTPYVPGKPIEETQREYKLKRVVKLASNENPLGPSPRALKALRTGVSQLHRYPDGSAFHLKKALSRVLKVDTNQLIVGNGSNEIIDFLVRTYCLPGDAIVTSQAAFIAYTLCAQIHGVRTIATPLAADLRFDLDAMLSGVQSDPRVKVVFVANPNNPTGTYMKTDELRAFLRSVQAVRDGSVLVALDYAYWEYVTAKDLPDPLMLMREFPNVIVMRTFSKVYGLAGLRVGYGVASADVIASIEKIRQPFNLNSLALAAAEAALGDKAFVSRSRKVNKQAKAFWEKSLKGLGIPFWPSQGNFLLADVGKGLGMTGAEVTQACLRQGVIFRPVGNYGLPQALRISFGTPGENLFALKALKAVRGGSR